MIQDYLDEDVAYLLGLLLVRGQLRQTDGVKQLILDFPFKNLEAASVRRKFNQRNEILLSLMPIRERINELLEVNLRQELGEHSVQLIADFTKNTMAWRNLRMLTQSKQDFRHFEVPKLIFEAPSSTKKK